MNLKSFLGLASNYRPYVQGFASIARPLHKASETSSSFQWTEETQCAFDSSKTNLTTTSVLAFPSLQTPFIPYTHPSQIAMTAMLAHEHDDCERVVCYASKALSKIQSKFSATRCDELLAILIFTRHSRNQLLGRPFTVVTEHRALQWLHRFEDPCGITPRWLEKLAHFDYEVSHCPGISIGHADGFSRIPSSFNAIAETLQQLDSNFFSDIYDTNYPPDSDETDHGPSYTDEWSNPDPLFLAANNSRRDKVPSHYREKAGSLFD